MGAGAFSLFHVRHDVGTFAVSAPNGTILNAGKYIVIWKRQPAGEWMIHRDIFNWDVRA